MTLAELRSRLREEGLLLVDVRSPAEYAGVAGSACDPVQGHIPGARNVPSERLLECRSAGEVEALVAAPPGTEIVAYCHSGARSGFAAQMLREAGYQARNYVGSWHEWSRTQADAEA